MIKVHLYKAKGELGSRVGGGDGWGAWAGGKKVETIILEGQLKKTEKNKMLHQSLLIHHSLQ